MQSTPMAGDLQLAGSCRLVRRRLIVLLSLAVTVIGTAGCTEADKAGPHPGDGSTTAASSFEIPELSIDMNDPSANSPVSVAAAVSPASARAGDLITLVVRTRLADSWHIYAVDQASGPTVPTTLSLTLPDGLEAVGQWKLPESEPFDTALGETHVYHHEATFAHQIRVGEEATDNLAIECEFGYQACNDSICHRPTTIPVNTSVQIETAP